MEDVKRTVDGINELNTAMAGLTIPNGATSLPGVPTGNIIPSFSEDFDGKADDVADAPRSVEMVLGNVKPQTTRAISFVPGGVLNLSGVSVPSSKLRGPNPDDHNAILFRHGWDDVFAKRDRLTNIRRYQEAINEALPRGRGSGGRGQNVKQKIQGRGRGGVEPKPKKEKKVSVDEPVRDYHGLIGTSLRNTPMLNRRLRTTEELKEAAENLFSVCKMNDCPKKLIDCYEHFRCCVCGGFDGIFERKLRCQCERPTFSPSPKLCPFCLEPKSFSAPDELPCCKGCEKQAKCPVCKVPNIRVCNDGYWKCEGVCKGDMKVCRHFAAGKCKRTDCLFKHTTQDFSQLGMNNEKPAYVLGQCEYAPTSEPDDLQRRFDDLERRYVELKRTVASLMRDVELEKKEALRWKELYASVNNPFTFDIKPEPIDFTKVASAPVETSLQRIARLSESKNVQSPGSESLPGTVPPIKLGNLESMNFNYIDKLPEEFIPSMYKVFDNYIVVETKFLESVEAKCEGDLRAPNKRAAKIEEQDPLLIRMRLTTKLKIKPFGLFDWVYSEQKHDMVVSYAIIANILQSPVSNVTATDWEAYLSIMATHRLSSCVNISKIYDTMVEQCSRIIAYHKFRADKLKTKELAMPFQPLNVVGPVGLSTVITSAKPSWKSRILKAFGSIVIGYMILRDPRSASHWAVSLRALLIRNLICGLERISLPRFQQGLVVMRGILILMMMFYTAFLSLSHRGSRSMLSQFQ